MKSSSYCHLTACSDDIAKILTINDTELEWDDFLIGW